MQYHKRLRVYVLPNESLVVVNSQGNILNYATLDFKDETLVKENKRKITIREPHENNHGLLKKIEITEAFNVLEGTYELVLAERRKCLKRYHACYLKISNEAGRRIIEAHEKLRKRKEREKQYDEIRQERNEEFEIISEKVPSILFLLKKRRRKVSKSCQNQLL
ncbi:MAG: hypothetical protein AABW80_02530 [Nanoarchaeota archaeon]